MRIKRGKESGLERKRERERERGRLSVVSARERRACEKERKIEKKGRKEGRKEGRKSGRRETNEKAKDRTWLKAIVKRVSCGRISF